MQDKIKWMDFEAAKADIEFMRKKEMSLLNRIGLGWLLKFSNDVQSSKELNKNKDKEDGLISDSK